MTRQETETCNCGAELKRDEVGALFCPECGLGFEDTNTLGEQGTRVAHTPGPWELRERPNSGQGFYVEPGIGEVYGAGQIPTANARLIAAAPELLEACKEFVRKCDNGEARSSRSYAQMVAAITKAEPQTGGAR